jgi:CHAT domain-containing protein
MNLRRTLVALAMAGVVTCVLVIELSRRAPWFRLNAAVRSGPYRPVEYRLSRIGYAPRPRDRAESAGTEQTRRLQKLAAEILGTRHPEDVKAAAAVLAGGAEEAVRRLEIVAARSETKDSIWNDLAAARATAAGATDDTQRLCSALAAADHALYLRPQSPPALFNRALILDSLRLRDAAEHAYADYLEVDGSSPWAIEARERLRVLQRSITARQAWQDQLAAAERSAANQTPGPLAGAVAQHPQDARTTAETEILGRWGISFSRGDRARAAQLLFLAREIGTTLQRTNGDAFVADAVAAIDEALAAGARDRVASLAAAHVRYREGRLQYSRREITAAAITLREAQRLFDEAASPVSLRVAYFRASAAVDAGDRAGAAAILYDLAIRVPLRYSALRADIDWLKGTTAGLDGFLERALESYRLAHMAFQALGEQRNATEMRDRLAALLTILGRGSEAWPFRRESFAAASREGHARSLQSALYSAASGAVREESWEIAHSLMKLVIAASGGNPRTHAEALVWWPLTAKRAGMDRAAKDDLRLAYAATGTLKDPGLRANVTNDLRIVEALLTADQNRAAAIALLTAHIRSAEQSGWTARVPQVLMERARLLAASGRSLAAEADLERAIVLVEQQRAAILRDDLRDSFLGRSGGAYESLADLLDRRGETQRAIAIADRRRARTILEKLQDSGTVDTAATPAELARLLPPDTAVLSFGVFEQRLVVYSISGRGVQRHPVGIGRVELERAIEQFRKAVTRNHAAARERGRALARFLLEPAAVDLKSVSTLIIVSETALQRIPFAALVGADGRYLAESHSIVVAPSLAAFTTALRAKPRSNSRQRLLAVADPLLDAKRYPSLPALPGAELEARKLSELYASSTMLASASATKRRVVSLLEQSDIAHFAVHTVVDGRDPRQSRILLSGNEGSLTVSEIAALLLQHLDLVVLAGCQTAVAGDGYGDVRSLAAAFLVAGARNVLATLWAAENAATRELSVAFHTALRDGEPPADALRAAQLRMIRSSDPALNNPGAWAAVQLYGSGQ